MMIRKLLIVYNPRSTGHKAVEAEILAKARQLTGFLVGKYEIKPTSFNGNVDNLSKMLGDGDLVIVAGGDGSAAIAVNGVMKAGKDVTLAAIGYGNFNDIAGMLGAKRPVDYGGEYVGGLETIVRAFLAGEAKEIYPLEVKVNGEFWRYVPCYMGIGLLAESTGVFEQPKVREKLRKGNKGQIFSLWQLVKWYFGHRKGISLPVGEINGVKMPAGTTDYMAVNGLTVAKKMKGGKWYRDKKKFLSVIRSLGNPAKMSGFVLSNMLRQMKGKVTERDEIAFDKPSEVGIHAEGEYQKLTEVSKIEVQKAEKTLKVIDFRK